MVFIDLYIFNVMFYFYCDFHWFINFNCIFVYFVWFHWFIYCFMIFIYLFKKQKHFNISMYFCIWKYTNITCLIFFFKNRDFHIFYIFRDFSSSDYKKCLYTLHVFLHFLFYIIYIKGTQNTTNKQNSY